MKKKIFSFLIFIFIFSLVGSVNAYSTNKYSIDIPSTYREATEGSFTKENGDNVNVQVVPFSGSSVNAFTEEGLNSLTKNINSEMDNYRTEMKEIIKEMYGEYLSDSEINEYVKSFKCDSIDMKEITTATKNNYKCYHIIASYSVGDYKFYVEQYSFISNKNIYTLTASVGEKSDLQSLETKNIINSFTIANYKDPEKSSFFSSDVWSKIIVTTIVAIIGVAIKHFADKGKEDIDDKDTKNNEKYEEDKDLEKIIDKIEEDNVNESDIEKNEMDINNQNEETVENKEDLKQAKRFCTKCGEEIEQDWNFCNNCGKKLK